MGGLCREGQVAEKSLGGFLLVVQQSHSVQEVV